MADPGTDRAAATDPATATEAEAGTETAAAAQQAEAAAEAALYALFTALGIAWVHHDHPPLRTVEDSRALRGDLPGIHVKNMALAEKKSGALWLVTCREDRDFRIRDLERAVGAKSSSFAKPEAMLARLGVRPGAVTPFALIAPGAGDVRFVLDPAVLASETLNAHPLHNRATTAIAVTDFRRLLAHLGVAPLMPDFDALEAMKRARAAEPAGGGGA
ncbi:MAG: prolyl-tRNA synthetase associated domain-containing protein [Pseudomonadota bacterium]